MGCGLSSLSGAVATIALLEERLLSQQQRDCCKTVRLSDRWPAPALHRRSGEICCCQGLLFSVTNALAAVCWLSVKLLPVASALAAARLNARRIARGSRPCRHRLSIVHWGRVPCACLAVQERELITGDEGQRSNAKQTKHTRDDSLKTYRQTSNRLFCPRYRSLER